MFHLDTDFLIHALTVRGPERTRLHALTLAGVHVRMSAMAWYEFSRGPRTPGEIALAWQFLGDAAIRPHTALERKGCLKRERVRW